VNFLHRSPPLVMVFSGHGDTSAGVAAEGQVTSALMTSMTEKIREALQVRQICRGTMRHHVT